jgi:VWFA-related protein
MGRDEREEVSTMNVKNQSRRALRYLAASVITGAFALVAASPVPAATNPVTMTITAVGKKQAPPAINKNDVDLFQNKERTQVANLRRGDSLFLGILIDDSLQQTVATDWSALRAFIMSQTPDTYVAVAYNRNGSAMVVQDFTNDHQQAAKALRIPTGSFGAFTSPYLAVQDWMKRWPDNGGDRRSIIMISSGVDYIHGGFGPFSADLDPSIERAQKKNINLWTIYYPDANRRGRRGFRTFNAQSNLERLSAETGAESYYLGFGRPVSIAPYLDQIKEHLDNQYLLSFVGGDAGKKGRFAPVRVATEVPNVKFLTPSEVFVPASSGR